MDWREYIHSDPGMLAGKPSIKGSRLAVDFILGLLAEGWTYQQLFENYPSLNPRVLQALFAYASECLPVQEAAKLKYSHYPNKVSDNVLDYVSVTRPPQLAVGRVAERVLNGGHNVPKDVIIRRYEAGLSNFFRVYQPVADHWRFYDNSNAFAPVLLATGEGNSPETVLGPQIWKSLKEKYL